MSARESVWDVLFPKITASVPSPIPGLNIADNAYGITLQALYWLWYEL